MKLLVTGGAGFIGSNFILYWLKHHPDDQIINFDALTYAGNLENLVDVTGDSRYTFIHGDICDSKAVHKALSGVDTVVHFAAESHVDRSIEDASPFVRTNVVGTQILLDACMHQKVGRFHHVSTDEVFGSLALDSREAFSETTPYNPRSPYSASKAASDHFVRAYFHTYGLPITITNCSNNFGPYHFPEKFIPLAITNFLEGKIVPLYGDGKNVRDWLYVEDHARAIDLVLTKGTIGETYCVGGSEHNISNLQVLEMIAEYLDVSNELIHLVKDRPGHDRRYAVDWSKIRTTLGWKPERSFRDWLYATIDWYKEHRVWWQHVKSGEYTAYYERMYIKR